MTGQVGFIARVRLGEQVQDIELHILLSASAVPRLTGPWGRCVAWTTVLRAVLLCNEDNAVLRSSNAEFDGTLPCSEEMWSASAIAWQNSPRATTSSVDCFRQLL